ncbi:MAG: hypothetical protein Q8P86_00460 [bacterium]|nr:hypothetical protein [bacterium]
MNANNCKVICLGEGHGIFMVTTSEGKGYIMARGGAACPCGSCISEEMYPALATAANEVSRPIHWVTGGHNHLDECDIDKYFPVKRKEFVLTQDQDVPQEVMRAAKDARQSARDEKRRCEIHSSIRQLEAQRASLEEELRGLPSVIGT